ncbi:MAG: CoA transferase [Proteobacteria bacterium]|nr:CoA transferase [Pseudomonadota bacterium]
MTKKITPGGRPALEGLRVIDFTHFIAGPYCTMMLGDLGADVVKIENPTSGGDSMRTFRPLIAGESGPFIWANRNKRSIAIDLATASGRQVVIDLVTKADVLVENFSTGIMERFGLSYEAVSRLNPRLIYCSISAYGREGPLKERTGFDPIVQAESGFMAVNGFEDREPIRTGPAIMDISTGMMACNGILAALAARSRDGVGQKVEIALFDVATTMVGYHAMNALLTNIEPRRIGNNSFDTAPMGVFYAADGPFYLAVANDRLFERLARDVLARPDLPADRRFATNADRNAHRDELFALLNGLFGSKGREHWLARMREEGVPAGAVRTLCEAFASKEMAARKRVTRIPHATAGEVPNIGSALHLAGSPVVSPTAAPTLGQHTGEVLREFGYSAPELAILSEQGAFGRPSKPADA